MYSTYCTYWLHACMVIRAVPRGNAHSGRQTLHEERQDRRIACKGMRRRGVAIPPPKSRLLLVLTASSPRGSVKVLFPPSWMSRQSDVQNQRVHCSKQVNEEDVSGLSAGVSRSQGLFAVRSEARAQNFVHKRRSVSCEELANLSIWNKPTNEQGLGAVSKPPPSNSPKRRGKSKNLSTEDRARGWENPTATAGGCAGGW